MKDIQQKKSIIAILKLNEAKSLQSLQITNL